MGKTEFELPQPKFLSNQSTETQNTGSTVVSPMPGVCDKILVSVGDEIQANAPVAVIIAMKMEYVLKAPRNGKIESVNSIPGKNVGKGEVIVRLVDTEAAEK